MRSKKQLLLINPPANADVGKQLHMENLGLGYVAAAVRRNLGDSHEAHIWDCSIVDPAGKFIGALLKKLSPDYVGLSLSTMNANGGVQVAAQIKEFDPSMRIILGGVLPTSLTTDELRIFSPDAIVRGEGEALVSPVLTALDAAAGPGEREVLEVSQDVPLDVDAVGWPSRDMLPWQLRLHPQTSISASRGCPYRCSFCSIPQPGGKKGWRPRNIEDVVAEMEFIHKRHHCAHFYFVDDNFVLPTAGSRKRAEHFAHLVLEKLPDIRFGFMCRSAAIEPELFRLLKKAGLAGVFLGIESFSQPVLDRYRKQETVEEHIEAISTLNDLGITTNPGFIFFDQWTKVSEINDTINVMKRIHFQSLESMNSKLTCYKGSAIADEITENFDEKPSIGIKKYALQDAAVKKLFDQCCEIFIRCCRPWTATPPTSERAIAWVICCRIFSIPAGKRCFSSIIRKATASGRRGSGASCSFSRTAPMPRPTRCATSDRSWPKKSIPCGGRAMTRPNAFSGWPAWSLAINCARNHAPRSGWRPWASPRRCPAWT
ncbi:Hopanoid 2-methyltransferase [Desulfovibrio sp. DV]|uniref:B12-binding domain-containing radical SAM protein n=1 Tax=Desulfovibrio sp. DV TaxID=1844708 RepID=UPI00094B91F4|nr:radical SAM protein [Desulfovibrio sp. DV]OLN29654.1 Hopanoid 2-methyltransferase [Desulfovibrio sp. DV]